MGGSQGARSLNTVVVEGTIGTGWQVLHLTGQDDFERVTQEVGDRVGYRVMAFCSEMGSALAAADFCLARSGASSLTELSHAGLPALMVPYPYAADDHQTANARVYERAGAAFLQTQDEVTAEKLTGILGKLTGESLEGMATAMKGLAEPEAAVKIAKVVEG
jgi:UDP-N-acetylglucosamine--N-acetylmuramyl-(pentapeptide) pyrophosphoryl-undecaprenol N-acetylglucosamine transferase